MATTDPVPLKAQGGDLTSGGPVESWSGQLVTGSGWIPPPPVPAPHGVVIRRSSSRSPLHLAAVLRNSQRLNNLGKFCFPRARRRFGAERDQSVILVEPRSRAVTERSPLLLTPPPIPPLILPASTRLHQITVTTPGDWGRGVNLRFSIRTQARGDA